MRKNGAWALGLAGAALALVWWQSGRPQGKPDEAAAARVVAAGSAPSPPAVAADGERRWLGELPAAEPAAVPGQGEPEPLSAQVARLAASGKPDDAWRAFGLIQGCIGLESYQKSRPVNAPPGMPPEQLREKTRLCAGLTQRMRMDRLDYLQRAAEAGIEGADTMLLAVGPFGDPDALRTRPDDPLVKQWREHALALVTRQAERGDTDTLIVMYGQYGIGSEAVPRDPQRQYEYGLALRYILLDMFGAEARNSPFDDEGLSGVRKELSEEQAAQAAARATKIAQAYRLAHPKT